MGLGLIIGLLVGGVILVLAEMMIPGMIAGIVGCLMIVTGIVLAFTRDASLGMGLLLGVVVLAVVMLWAWARFFPKSRLGKKMFLEKDAKEWHGFESKNAAMLGKKGVAHSMLRPSGVALIDGERVDVVTEGEIVERGQPIQVVEVEGNRVVVAKVAETETTSGEPA